jgi:hypothetical protein
MKLSLQARTVLAHLRAEPHITSWTAEGVYGIRRLASRVDEIVAAGYEIKKTEARDRRGQRYVRYALSLAQLARDEPIYAPRKRITRYTGDQVGTAAALAGVCPCTMKKFVQHLMELTA